MDDDDWASIPTHGLSDPAVADRLMDLVIRASVEAVDLPVAIACVSPGGGILTLEGPYSDEVAALAALMKARDDDEAEVSQYVVFPLLPPMSP